MKPIRLTIFLCCMALVLRLNLAFSQGEEISIDGELFGEQVRISAREMNANAQGDILQTIKGNYAFGPVWTIFELQPEENVTLNTWDLEVSCGCQARVCGTHCRNDTCDQKITQEFFFPESWVNCERTANYCWNILVDGTSNHTSSRLAMKASLALTSYGGPDTPFEEPGWTLIQTNDTQNYSYNAAITDLIPRKEVDLDSLRYLENYGLVSTEDIERKKEIPKPKINWTETSCIPDEGVNRKVNFSYEWPEAAVERNPLTSFTEFSVLRQAKKELLRTLDGVSILGPYGVRKWFPNMNEFTYFDLCQFKFLQMRREADGTYFVILPANENMVTNGLCIAVSDNPQYERDLVLYESLNNTSSWTSSNKFTGLLSNDYLSSVNLSFTLQMSVPLFDIPHINVIMEPVPLSNDFLLTLTTSRPLSCRISLQKDKDIWLYTLPGMLKVRETVPYSSQFEQKGFVDCEGTTGFFYIPNPSPNSEIVDGVRNIANVLTTRPQKIVDEPRNDRLKRGNIGVGAFIKGLGGGFKDVFSWIWNFIKGVFRFFWNFVSSLGTVTKILFFGVLLVKAFFICRFLYKTLKPLFKKKGKGGLRVTKGKSKQQQPKQEQDVKQKPKSNLKSKLQKGAKNISMKKVTYGEFKDEKRVTKNDSDDEEDDE